MFFSVYINSVNSKQKDFNDDCEKGQTKCPITDHEGLPSTKCVDTCVSLGCTIECYTMVDEEDSTITSSLNVLETNNIKTRNNRGSNFCNINGVNMCCYKEKDRDDCLVAHLRNVEGYPCDHTKIIGCNSAETDSHGICQCTECINSCYSLKQEGNFMICEPVEEHIELRKDINYRGYVVKVKYKKKFDNITPPTKKGYTFEGYYWDINYKEEEKYISSEGEGIRDFDKCLDAPEYSSDLYPKFTPTIYNCPAGKYLDYENAKCETCTANSYCPGGQYKYDNPKGNQGKENCKDEPQPESSDSGSKSREDCYVNCPSGFLCYDGRYYKHRENTGIYLCKEGYYLYAESRDGSKDPRNEISADPEGELHKSENDTRHLCYPCEGLYNKKYDNANMIGQNYVNISNEDKKTYLSFSSKICERNTNSYLKTDTLPTECTDIKGPENGFITNQNNSHKDSYTARKSCYINFNGIVEKDFGLLELYGDCHYDVGTKNVKP